MAKEEIDEEDKQKVKTEEAKVIQVATEYGFAYQVGSEVLDEKEMLVRIFNDVQKIKKSVA